MENWGNIVKTDHKAEFNLPFFFIGIKYWCSINMFTFPFWVEGGQIRYVLFLFIAFVYVWPALPKTVLSMDAFLYFMS